MARTKTRVMQYLDARRAEGNLRFPQLTWDPDPRAMVEASVITDLLREQEARFLARIEALELRLTALEGES